MKKSEKEKIVKDNANKTSVELAVIVASEKVYEFIQAVILCLMEEKLKYMNLLEV